MKIAVLDDYQDVAFSMADWSAVERDAEVTVFDRHLGPIDQVIEAIADFEVVSLMRERTPFPREMFERLPKLKLLLTSGHFNSAIDLEAARDHGVTVCGTDTIGRTTVEQTWALLMAAARNVALEDRAMREGRWQVSLGHTLEGKTLGLVGLGRLGQQVAEIARVFRMNLVAWSANLTAELAAEHGARLVSKEELFTVSDFVGIHLRLSERTRGLIARQDLARMKPSAWIINTARGEIIDQADLIDALERRRIGGAAMDVYEVEPLPVDHPFRKLPNTVLSPHKGFVTEESYRIFYGETVENIRAWMDGKPIRIIENNTLRSSLAARPA
ncbi:MAG: D-2-hydroxyacid dehydrogenase family protein [Rhodospirillales bacterium]|nr:D-2-hydroxyacid dehydrogenase family protein [Rhodospirillales bacterium]